MPGGSSGRDRNGQGGSASRVRRRFRGPCSRGGRPIADPAVRTVIDAGDGRNVTVVAAHRNSEVTEVRRSVVCRVPGQDLDRRAGDGLEQFDPRVSAAFADEMPGDYPRGCRAAGTTQASDARSPGRRHVGRRGPGLLSCARRFDQSHRSCSDTPSHPRRWQVQRPSRRCRRAWRLWRAGRVRPGESRRQEVDVGAPAVWLPD